jgi:hypothetical protein
MSVDFIQDILTIVLSGEDVIKEEAPIYPSKPTCFCFRKTNYRRWASSHRACFEVRKATLIYFCMGSLLEVYLWTRRMLSGPEESMFLVFPIELTADREASGFSIVCLHQKTSCPHRNPLDTRLVKILCNCLYWFF